METIEHAPRAGSGAPSRRTAPAPAPEHAATPAPPRSEPRRATPVSVSVVLLAVCATVFFLRWAQSFLVPLVLGAILAFALNPLVNRLHRLHVPRSIAAGLVLALAVGSMGFVVYSLHDEAMEMVEQVPKVSERLSRAMREWRRGEPGAFGRMRAAAVAVERAANEAATAPAPSAARAPMRVRVDAPPFELKNLMWTGSAGAAAMVWQTIVVIFLVFFLLVTGDALKRKFVQVAGTTLRQRRLTVVVLDQVGAQIQAALVVLVATNVLLGLLTWLAFEAMGIERAGLWGLIAGVLHLVPYFGPGFVAVAAGVAGFLQFEGLTSALLAAGATLTISTVIGMFLMPWLQGRASRMNPTAVFIGLLFWGWLWGVWGLLLATPVMAVIKVICDHVEHLKPVSELMSA